MQLIFGQKHCEDGILLCQEKLKFSATPTGDPRQLQRMSRIIKTDQEKQLWSKIVSLDRKTLRYAKTKCCFKHVTYGLKKL